MYYIGQGKVYAAVVANGVPGAFRFLSNCTALNVQFATETQEHKESTSGQRLTDGRVITGKSANVQMTLDDWTKENLALAMYGQSAAITGSTVTAEALPDALVDNDIVRLRYPNVSSVVVQDSAGTPATLTENTNYKINSANHGSLQFLDVAGFTQPFNADYTYGDHSRVGMFTAAPDELWLRFEGLNTANGNSPVLIELYRSLLDPLGQLDAISEEYGALDLNGSVLYDTNNEADAELGPFGRVIYV